MSGSKLDTAKLALGMVYFLRSAINEHRKQHHGDKPRGLILHPNLRPALLHDLRRLGMPCSLWCAGEHDAPTFEGIPLTFDEVEYPRMVTVRYEVVPL